MHLFKIYISNFLQIRNSHIKTRKIFLLQNLKKKNLQWKLFPRYPDLKIEDTKNYLFTKL